MKIIQRFLVILLMSMVTSVVCAQTSKTTNVANLSEKDIATIQRALIRNKSIAPENSVLVKSLIQNNNTPLTGVVTENDTDFIEVVSAQKGDEWVAFVCLEEGTFWLTYVINRKKKFFCRYSVRLD
ncbi:MAG: hypothetical protein IJ545_03230 [Alphaproteobacteria bacterium]|nr:hypothetical protein [Alphaproteobacteria bacterium]